MKGKEKFYYIEHLDVVGKGHGFAYQIYKNGHWEQDSASLISDRLIGYDPFEPSDSPYKIGCLSVMREIEEITEQEAMEIINRMQG